MKNLKKLLTIAVFSLICQIGVLSVVEGQNIGINEPNPDNSALMEMTSSDKGLLVPRMTTAERDAIVNPADGLIIYNTNDTCLNLYRYDHWYNICCCDASTPSPFIICGSAMDVVDVTNGTTGEIWMDRNLGASQQATAYNDYQAYGALFQWGRLSDGHECITWTNSTTGTPDNGTTTTLSATDDPGHSLFIITSSLPNDWRAPQNNILWQGVSGINNPCPSGYRLPTEAELETERTSWGSNNYNGAYGSSLKFVVAGHRYYSDGVLTFTGSGGTHWSSTVDGVQARILNINIIIASISSYDRSGGFSVRCIKD